MPSLLSRYSVQSFESLDMSEVNFNSDASLFQSTIVQRENSSKLTLTNRYNANDPAFFKEFDDLLAEHEPLNFGVGFPDVNPPEILKNALAKAALSDNYKLSQYALGYGLPRLLEAVARMFSKFINRTLNPRENVIITVGATEALFTVFQAYTNPDDEWIVFSPYFLPFASAIKAAGGVPRYVPLLADKTTGYVTSADFKFNRHELANSFNKRTKGILLNTPHNPTGKIFDRDELMYIAELANQWDVLVVLDEVYQFMIYNEDDEHHRIATFPGMFERTISIGSATKMFCATGYRVGWAYGPKNLISHLKTVNTFVVMCASTPLQEAVAEVIEMEIENYGQPHSCIEQFRRECIVKRDRIYNSLKDVGMMPVLTHSGYFIIANWTTMTIMMSMDDNNIRLDRRSSSESIDYSFVRWMVKNLKIFAQPLSRAYGDDYTHVGQNYLRFAMIKSDETLERLDVLLKKWKFNEAQKGMQVYNQRREKRIISIARMLHPTMSS